MENTIQKIQTGIPELDVVLRGGLPEGRVYLLDGLPGTGKTTVGLKFLIEGRARRQRGLYIALSESEAELRAEAGSHGWELSDIDILEITPTEAMQADDQTVLEPSELGLGQVVEQILKAVEAVKPQRIVIDSLAEIRLLADDSKRYIRQIVALRHSFRSSHATVMALNDLTDETEYSLHALVHGVVSLEMLERDYGAARRRLRISKMRGADYQSGWHDFAIQRGELLVFPSLIAEEHGSNFEPGEESTGLTCFDKMLGGGLTRGTTTMLIGPSGVGKSSIALQTVLAAVQRGQHAIYFSFDEAHEAMTARAKSLGFNLDPALASGQLQWERASPTRISPGEFVWKVRRAVEDRAARLVVIDSLNSYLETMPQERALMLQMHELLSYLSNHGVVTILIMAQRGIMGNFENSIDLSFLSDSLVLLKFAEVNGQLKRAISVVKKRTGAHDDRIREFSLSSDGLHIDGEIKGLQGLLVGEPKVIGK